MRLSIHDLAKIFEVTIEYLKQQDVKGILFWDEDFYPVIRSQNLNFGNSDFLKCPTYGLGSLDHDIEVWKSILDNKKEAVYEISGEIIRKLGGILTAFGQVSDKLNNPSPITNIALHSQSPIALTLDELQEIFNFVIESLKMWYNSPDISFRDPRYIKIPLKNEYLTMRCPPYTIGSLDDAIKTWKEILNDTSKPSAHAIEMLGDLLTAFGQEIDPK